MELRHLECFVEIVRQGGFSAAAQVLHTTQPTISKALKQLEHECGTPLLDRLGNGVRVTDAGELVLRRATAMLSEREHLQGELAALHGVEQGSRRLEEMVRQGEIELGATLAPVPEDMEWQEVIDEPLIALLPRGHPAAGRDSIRFHELAEDPFILFERGFVINHLIAAACQKRGITLREVARGAHADFIIALVSSGLGVSMLPHLEVNSRSNLSVETALIDEPDLRWHLGLIWRSGSTLSPAAKKWLDLVSSIRFWK